MLYFFPCTVISMYMNIERFKSDIIPLREKLFVLALKIMEDEAEAEDAVQETLLKLWSKREQLGDIANPAGFAMQTTKNICIDKIRVKKNAVEANDFYIGANENTPYSQTEIADSITLIRRIIDTLPELQKIIIKMRDIEGYELEEIAEITGTQVNAVTVNLSRARKKVRDQFISISNYVSKQLSTHNQ